MLEIRHVSKYYSGIPAVEDVSFFARPGELPATSARMGRESRPPSK